VTDGPSVTNATIAVTSTDGSVLNFRNDGVSPDKTANNGTYSASYTVPTNLTSVTLTLLVSAPDKATSTNIVTYAIIPLPANDSFNKFGQGARCGASYISNNRFASMEPANPLTAALLNRAGHYGGLGRRARRPMCSWTRREPRGHRGWSLYRNSS